MNQSPQDFDASLHVTWLHLTLAAIYSYCLQLFILDFSNYRDFYEHVLV